MTDGMHGIVSPFEGTAHVGWDDALVTGSPLRLYATTVPREWVDYNRHMSESGFLLAFGNNSDAFFRFIGVDEAYRDSGRSLFTVETHMHNIAQAREGDRLDLSLTVLDLDHRRVHILHTMSGADTGETIAAGEQLLVHVDTTIGRSSDLPAELHDRLLRLRGAHAALPRPAFVGRPIGIRRR